MTKKGFLEKVELFLKRFSITPSTFGKMVLRQPMFVFQLRAGRECREETQQKVLQFIENYRGE